LVIYPLIGLIISNLRRDGDWGKKVGETLLVGYFNAYYFRGDFGGNIPGRKYGGYKVGDTPFLL